MSNLETKISQILNSHSLEQASNTPDFILARYLLDCLAAYNTAVTARAEWYGRMDIPGRGSVPFGENGKEQE